MNRTIITSLGAMMALAIGCSHAPTKELVAARESYEGAAGGPAGQLAKAEVYEAQKALAAAVRAHDEKPGSSREADLAYVALRKADYANAFAEQLVVEEAKSSAQSEYVKTLEELKSTAQSRLSETEGALSRTSADLEKAKAERAALENQLSAAMTSLSDMAKIKQEEQRTTITLTGSLLFKSNDDKLLPIAEQKLQQVADVLKQYGDEYIITVKGHTDSSGRDDHNMQLSQRRADSVRTYLVKNGVHDTAVRAEGMGETAPIADNKSAEGRAQNRRVEIIVDRADAQPGGATPAGASNK